MAEERVSVDALLERQDRVLATVEAVPGSDDRVRVTPLAPGSGCACELGIVIPKDEIGGLIVTDEVRNCCGKRLPVVEVDFANDTVALVFQQLGAAARRSSRSHGSAPAGRTRALPVAAAPRYGQAHPARPARRRRPAPAVLVRDRPGTVLRYSLDPDQKLACEEHYRDCQGYCYERSAENEDFPVAACVYECARDLDDCLFSDLLDKWD
ncbi:hypothetical protein ACZ90_30225 [Streptomyces albus subsp. albus]|nr:hypothetical protein ACZ90_30225 [Streptomyces albus subsp. albus]